MSAYDWRDDWQISDNGLTLTYKTGEKVFFTSVPDLVRSPMALRFWDRIAMAGIGELRSKSNVDRLIRQSEKLFRENDPEGRYIKSKKVYDVTGRADFHLVGRKKGAPLSRSDFEENYMTAPEQNGRIVA